MITKSNYFAEVKNIGVSKLTDSLAKTHTFIEKITKNGSNWDISNPVLSEVIKNHFVLINAFEQEQAGDFLKKHVIVAKIDKPVVKRQIISKGANLIKTDMLPNKFKVSKGDTLFDVKKQKNITVTKVSKPSKTSALKDEPLIIDIKYNDGKKAINMPVGERFVEINETAIAQPEPSRKKAIKIKVSKTARKKSKTKRSFVKPEKAPVTVKKYSLELQHIKKYLNMEGKNVKSTSLFRFEEAISKAIKSDDYLTHKTLLTTIHSTISQVCEKLKASKIEYIDNLNLTSEFKIKCKDIIAGAKVRLRTEYLAGFSDTEVYLDVHRKKHVLIDTRTNQRWANEFFKSADEAKEFAKQNKREIVDKREDLGCDSEKKK
jgi:hypothetical protein